jgi:2,4-dienoyl-CoA reductase-like NADH-dependent reductase (Old Yellow Enzyme family)
MAFLFDPLPIRGIELPNRIAVSPMCQYSSQDGFANDWHLVHLGSRAVGGAGTVFTEASAVSPEGRIMSQGSVPGIQLAHAGRKGSTRKPSEGGGAHSPVEGGWVPIAPSARPYSPEYPQPEALTREGIRGVVEVLRKLRTGRSTQVSKS